MKATADQLKEIVKEKYGQIAEQTKGQNESSCCGATGCGTIDYTVMADDYSKMKGYVADADLGLGCGLPTEFALIKEGDTVVDLGSGAGNDCFIARSITGESGKIIGIDFSWIGVGLVYPSLLRACKTGSMSCNWLNDTV